MSNLERLSFSIEQPLADRLANLVRQSGYANRSEFIRDLIRSQLVKQEWQRNHEVVGTITLIFDHHVRGLTEKLVELQHHHHTAILASTHVHLDQHLCVETLMVRGKAGRVRQIADMMRRPKGVLHSELSMSSTGRELEH